MEVGGLLVLILDPIEDVLDGVGGEAAGDLPDDPAVPATDHTSCCCASDSAIRATLLPRRTATHEPRARRWCTHRLNSPSLMDHGRRSGPKGGTGQEGVGSLNLSLRRSGTGT